MQMITNATNKDEKLIYPELSYLITGVCFSAHNELGRFCKEKQYADLLELKFKSQNINYVREFVIGDTGNRVDFLIENKIILELKAKNFIVREDYYQLQRYLQSVNKKLGLLVNFRQRYIKPARVIMIETDARLKFV